MKIIFLGFEPFLGKILSNLRGTPFLEQNEIEICIVYNDNKVQYYSKKIFKNFYLIKKNFIFKFYSKIVIALNYLLFQKRYRDSLDHIFPKNELGFLKDKKNIIFSRYNGLQNLKNLKKFDLMIVASFNEKIPQNVFNKPKNGTLNIHPSFLPKHRGGYPTFCQALEGDKNSATSIHIMDKGWDSGHIVNQKKKTVNSISNNFEREKKSTQLAAILLNELHESNFNFSSSPQLKSEVTYCHKIAKPIRFLYHIKYNIEGAIRANYHPILFPFTYCYIGLFVFSILEIKKIGKIESKKKIRVYKKNAMFYLVFNSQLYFINKYIYKGIYHD